MSPTGRPRAITPVVSVVMCTYNGERFLRPAIESILNQTFPGFELIVVDDGSTDSTPRILAEFKDDHLIVVTNERNLGIAGATNTGLALARGQYVALQDHHDISLPHRFHTQVEYLDSHPEIVLVGSAATLIDDDGVAYGFYAEPAGDVHLKWEVLFRCPISHTSVMCRRRAMLDRGGYSTDPPLRFASDYDFLSRLAMRYSVANIPAPLVLWRRHRGAAMLRHEELLLNGIERVSLRNIGIVAASDGTPNVRNQTDRYLVVLRGGA